LEIAPAEPSAALFGGSADSAFPAGFMAIAPGRLSTEHATAPPQPYAQQKGAARLVLAIETAHGSCF
jgi:hypothetical protein